MIRNILVVLIILTCMALMVVVAKADVYVITNAQNNVYSVSNLPDAVVPAGDTLTVIKGQSVQNLPITGDPTLYNFTKGAFIINATAVQAQQAAQAAIIAQQTATANAQASAIAKLTDALNRVASQDVLTATEMQALLPAVNVSIPTTSPSQTAGNVGIAP